MSINSKGIKGCDKLLVLFLLLIAAAGAVWFMSPAKAAEDLDGKVIYITKDGAGLKDGTSWNNAYAGASLDHAVTEAEASASPNKKEVWAASGEYLRTATLTLAKGAKLYGGFAGTEPASSDIRDRRDYRKNETILRRDPALPDDSQFFSMVTGGMNATSADTRLDGITVTGGKTNDYKGAGMYNGGSSPTVINCTFSANSTTTGSAGGAGCMTNMYSSPTVTNCTFSANRADSSDKYAGISAGAMVNESSSHPIITNSTFSANSVTSPSGGAGAIFNTSSSPIVTNCTFSANSATGKYYAVGGMVSNQSDSSPIVTNCIFWNNGEGSEISYVNGSTVTLANSIVKGGYSGPGTATKIIDADPKLTPYDRNGNVIADPAADSADVYIYKIDCDSSALGSGLDVGTSASAAAVPAADQLGRPRLADYVDLGAYQYTLAEAEKIYELTLESASRDIVRGTTLTLPIASRPVTKLENVTYDVAHAEGSADISITADKKKLIITGTTSGPLWLVLQSRYSDRGASPMVTEEFRITPVLAESITLTGAPSAAIEVGAAFTVTAAVTPASADDKAVTWSVSGGLEITSQTDGTVTVTATGRDTGTVTATAKDGGGATAAVNITVTGRAVSPDVKPGNTTDANSSGPLNIEKNSKEEFALFDALGDLRTAGKLPLNINPVSAEPIPAASADIDTATEPFDVKEAIGRYWKLGAASSDKVNIISMQNTIYTDPAYKDEKGGIIAKAWNFLIGRYTKRTKKAVSDDAYLPLETVFAISEDKIPEEVKAELDGKTGEALTNAFLNKLHLFAIVHNNADPAKGEARSLHDITGTDTPRYVSVTKSGAIYEIKTKLLLFNKEGKVAYGTSGDAYVMPLSSDKFAKGSYYLAEDGREDEAYTVVMAFASKTKNSASISAEITGQENVTWTLISDGGLSADITGDYASADISPDRYLLTFPKQEGKKLIVTHTVSGNRQTASSDTDAVSIDRTLKWGDSLTVSAQYGEITADAITLDQSQIQTTTASAGLTLTAAVRPETAKPVIEWTSSSNDIATVAADPGDQTRGKVTIHKAGTATITAKTKDNKTASCVIDVKNAVTAASADIAADKTQIAAAGHKTARITITLQPDAEDYDVQWSVVPTETATVKPISGDKRTAIAAAKAAGTATITAKLTGLRSGLNVEKTVEITIVKAISHEDFRLTADRQNLGKGEKSHLTLSTHGTAETFTTPSWSLATGSTATGTLASTAPNGTTATFTAEAPGTAIIQATMTGTISGQTVTQAAFVTVTGKNGGKVPENGKLDQAGSGIIEAEKDTKEHTAIEKALTDLKNAPGDLLPEGITTSADALTVQSADVDVTPLHTDSADILNAVAKYWEITSADVTLISGDKGVSKSWSVTSQDASDNGKYLPLQANLTISADQIPEEIKTAIDPDRPETLLDKINPFVLIQTTDGTGSPVTTAKNLLDVAKENADGSKYITITKTPEGSYTINLRLLVFDMEGKTKHPEGGKGLPYLQRLEAKEEGGTRQNNYIIFQDGEKNTKYQTTITLAAKKTTPGEKEVTLDKQYVEIYTSTSVALTASADITKIADKPWSVSDTGTITVAQDMQNPLKATVTGVKEGKATVTFTASDGRYAKCEITVKKPQSGGGDSGGGGGCSAMPWTILIPAIFIAIAACKKTKK